MSLFNFAIKVFSHAGCHCENWFLANVWEPGATVLIWGVWPGAVQHLLSWWKENHDRRKALVLIFLEGLFLLVLGMEKEINIALGVH